MKTGGLPGKAQAEAGALTPGLLVLQGIEPLKQARHGILWNAGALIQNSQMMLRFSGGEPDFNLAAGR